jgi:hypothetical protein
MTHALKTWPEYFQATERGDKKFEVRKADRPFSVGDKLVLQEYEPKTKEYTGKELEFSITCLVDTFGVKKGYVVMGIKEIDLNL